ncbi:MAG TPA: class I SAM-dependent methyltransferase [Acidimicrobiales bacterium]|nr:class I SAM-dependent methyltransferase [Acidimicrobiales bacterium]
MKARPLERTLRRMVPSVARLTYNPAVKSLLAAADVLPRVWFKEFRDLPPNHLRVRVGVHNRLFANQVVYLRRGISFWLWAFGEQLCALDSDIVEIGCGCGRRPHHLRDFKFQDRRYTGSYLGIDVDREMLEWCRANFDAPRFEFVQSTHASAAYRNDQAEESEFRIPRPDGSVDFVFGTSVLTHVLEPGLVNYLREGARILRPGRFLAMSCFCTDYPPATYGGRHTFPHQIGSAWVESLKVPEAAVAYPERFLLDRAGQAGFAEAELRRNPGGGQHMLLCRR